MKKNIKKENKKKDEEWKKKIKLRDKSCILCGSKKILQGAHLFSRSYGKIRHDPNNGVALCVRHHIYWMRSHPIEFTWMMEKRFGKRKLKSLYKKTGQTWYI